MAIVEIKVPDIGDVTDVSVIELMVKPGDTIQPEQSLITVESDKASMEIPASARGAWSRNSKSSWATRSSEGSSRADAGSRRLLPSPVPTSAPASNQAQPPRSTCAAAPKTVAPASSDNASPCTRGQLRWHVPTSTATCWCSAVAQAATRPPSALRTWG